MVAVGVRLGRTLRQSLPLPKSRKPAPRLHPRLDFALLLMSERLARARNFAPFRFRFFSAAAFAHPYCRCRKSVDHALRMLSSAVAAHSATRAASCNPAYSGSARGSLPAMNEKMVRVPMRFSQFTRTGLSATCENTFCTGLPMCAKRRSN